MKKALLEEAALAAWIMETYHYTPAEISRLTPAQTARLIGHARTKDGAIRFPFRKKKAPPAPPVPPPATLEEALERLAVYYGLMGLGAEELARAEVKLKTRWEKDQREDESCRRSPPP